MKAPNKTGTGTLTKSGFEVENPRGREPVPVLLGGLSPARIAAVVCFEFRRTATLPRLAWWAVLAFFPVAIVSLLVGFDARIDQRDEWTGILFTLIPSIVCMLSLLLWATPILQSELEGNSWPYLAVRPHGKVSVLLGKYLTALGWTAAAGWTGLTISLAIAQPERAVRLWIALAALVLLATISYGALFTFIGVLMHKRPMVVAVAYALIFEFIVGLIPAMINQFTVQLRLRSLLLAWVDWEGAVPPQLLSALSDTGSPVKHVLILLVASVALVAASAWLLQQKTLVTASD